MVFALLDDYSFRNIVSGRLYSISCTLCVNFMLRAEFDMLFQTFLRIDPPGNALRRGAVMLLKKLYVYINRKEDKHSVKRFQANSGREEEEKRHRIGLRSRGPAMRAASFVARLAAASFASRPPLI